MKQVSQVMTSKLLLQELTTLPPQKYSISEMAALATAVNLTGILFLSHA